MRGARETLQQETAEAWHQRGRVQQENTFTTFLLPPPRFDGNGLEIALAVNRRRVSDTIIRGPRQSAKFKRGVRDGMTYRL